MRKYLLLTAAAALALPALNSCGGPTGEPADDAEALAGLFEDECKLDLEMKQKYADYIEYYAENEDYDAWKDFLEERKDIMDEVKDEYEKELEDLEEDLEDALEKLNDKSDSSDDDD